MPTRPFDTNENGYVLVGPVGSRQQILVKGLDITAADQVVVSLKRGSATVWKTYAMNDAATLGGIVLNFDRDRDLGQFDTNGDQVPSGGSLTLSLDGAVAVAGSISYEVIGPTG